MGFPGGSDSEESACNVGAAKSLQSCPTLCDPIDSSPPGSAVTWILQARTLEWVAISSSNAWKWKVKVKSLSHVWLSATPWTAAYQAPPSMGFSRQEYWSGSPWDLGSFPGEGWFPWRREWLSTLVFLPEDSHGQRSLVGYNSKGHRESDMIERLTQSFELNH